MTRQGPSITDLPAAHFDGNARHDAYPGPDVIRSRDNRRLKAFRAALRGGGPASGEPIAVEGPKLIEEALHAELLLESLLVSESGEKHLERILLAARETEEGIPRSRIFRTTGKLFDGVAATETPQGVAALFRQPEWTLQDVLRGAASPDGSFRGDPSLVVVIVGVQDPGNTGTIVRSAEAFGATGVIATRGTADPWSPKAVRASAGSALRLPLLRSMAPSIVLAQLRVAGVRVIAATSRLENDPANRQQPPRPQALGSADVGANLSEPCAIMIGSEGQGLPPEIRHSADAILSIPINAGVDSLNAAVAASVLLYEAARRRRAAS